MTKKNIGLNFDQLLEKLRTYNDEEELEVVKKAYTYAAKMHFGVKRMTGEDYIEHPLNVAYILAEMNADCATIAAALLHDVLEDCDVTYDELQEMFGKEITDLVDGVTKINKLNFETGSNAVIATQRKILVGLCEEANTTISSILMLNGYSKSQVSGMLPVYDISNDSLTYTDVSSGRMDVIGIERITDDEEGPYFMVKLSNGRSFKLYDQYKWAGKKLRIKRNKEINMGGSGCSIFALGTTLQYLTGNMDITMKDVTRANGGQFYGFHEMYSGNDVLEVNGVKYTVDSDVSDKKIYGASSDKTEVLNDWEETLNKGGIIYLNATKRKKGYVDYRGRKVDSSTLREMTGIASEGGHIIAIMGIDSNNEIIFADSMLHFDGNSDNYEYGLHKNLTLEEFYDIYGGTRPTYVTSRYYYTVTEATLVPVE